MNGPGVIDPADVRGSSTVPAAAHRAARRGGRSNVVLGSLATLVALWLGLTAPTVSPVAPAPVSARVAIVPAQQQAADILGGGGTQPVQPNYGGGRG